MQKSDGMNYAPEGRPEPVVEKGEFPFAAVAFGVTVFGDNEATWEKIKKSPRVAFIRTLLS